MSPGTAAAAPDSGTAPGDDGDAGPPAPAGPARQHGDLALLAWPEAAGTSPEQREALELSVRHRLRAHEIAAVLGLERALARELLASAACEVERTRAALAVVEKGACPAVARLSGDHHLLLGSALRRELVRHVDDCPHCRRTAERAATVWPGTSVTPAELPLLPAPLAALGAALAHRARARGGAPRFDRSGFPMDPKDRAARRDRLRARAVTSTVVATVIAAPVLALWAAYRGAPFTADGAHGGTVTAAEGSSGDPDGDRGDDRGEGRGDADDRPDGTPDGYENAGSARATPGAPGAGRRAPDVSVEVIGGSPPAPYGAGGLPAPGRLLVAARHRGPTTLITLTATGGAPVRWAVRSRAPWLRISQGTGTLAPGRSLTLQAQLDPRRQPRGPWSARIVITPASSVVLVEGQGPTRPGHHPPARDRPPHHLPSPVPAPGGPGTSSPGPPTDETPGPGDPPSAEPPQPRHRHGPAHHGGRGHQRHSRDGSH